LIYFLLSKVYTSNIFARIFCNTCIKGKWQKTWVS